MDRKEQKPQISPGFGRVAWLPIPVLLAAILALWIADLRTVCESRALMVLLNVVFTWLASLCICLLTARGFLVNGQPGLLMFGCGSLLWGVTSLAAAVVVDRVNATITVHNTLQRFYHMLSSMGHQSGADAVQPGHGGPGIAHGRTEKRDQRPLLPTWPAATLLN
ncbi:MAG: hypothetical protein NT154_21070 [Verrucomicrobia bacterium]|nr:hypothetical protein [Verrucomicrobiota bacterium]